MSSVISAKPNRRGDALALAAGALLPLAFAPFTLFPLAWLAPALLFLLLLSAAPRQAFRRGFLFGLGQFGVGVSWVYVAIHDFGYTAAPIAALLTFAFVAVLALYPALFGYVAARLGEWIAAPGLRLMVLLPALWTLFEWVRGRFLTGFPWLNLGYSQIDTPLAGLAPVAGIYGLSWAAALTGGALAYVWLARRGALATALPLLALLWLGGAVLERVAWVHPLGKPLSVALVQGNQPQLTKWDPDGINRRLKAYAELSLERFGKVDLVVWPENAVTLFYQETAKDYFAPMEKAAKVAGTDLILGVPLLDEDGERYYTTMMSLGSSHGFYRKIHLVPFGEFVPLAGMLRGLIGFLDLPMSGFSPGPAHQPPLSVAGRKAAISICYEDAFGEEIIAGLPEANLLVNGSNNAWYGDSLAPHQHLQIARMRSLESGRPLLRATTNGISAITDAHGKLLATSPQFRTWVLEGAIQPMAGATPFARWGNFPVLLLLVLSLGAVAVLGRRAGRVAVETGGFSS